MYRVDYLYTNNRTTHDDSNTRSLAHRSHRDHGGRHFIVYKALETNSINVIEPSTSSCYRHLAVGNLNRIQSTKPTASDRSTPSTRRRARAQGARLQSNQHSLSRDSLSASATEITSNNVGFIRDLRQLVHFTADFDIPEIVYSSSYASEHQSDRPNGSRAYRRERRGGQAGRCRQLRRIHGRPNPDTGYIQ